jgi:leucyl aminopeptidase (aminopeptidase T)
VSWPNREIIEQSIVDMLRVNMGLKTRERLLVVGDYPQPQEWKTADPTHLEIAAERLMLARLVAEIALDHFAENTIDLQLFPTTGRHGSEPDGSTAIKMREADVAICLTSFSLSHTNAREEASRAGTRIASMPGFTHQMLAPGGPMAVDYVQIAADCRRFADLLTTTNDVIVRTPFGTDLRFSITGRPGQVDDGLYGKAGNWGNLPAGEGYSIPVESTGQGRLAVLAKWHPGLEENMLLHFENGMVVKLEGGGVLGDHFRQILSLGNEYPLYQARRNLAELGIGTNPNASQPDNILESEKIKGTVHIAIGDNIHMGGQVESDLHEDFVQPHVDLLLDGEPIIIGGEWQLP